MLKTENVIEGAAIFFVVFPIALALIWKMNGNARAAVNRPWLMGPNSGMLIPSSEVSLIVRRNKKPTKADEEIQRRGALLKEKMESGLKGQLAEIKAARQYKYSRHY
jgi:hypothetical protein